MGTVPPDVSQAATRHSPPSSRAPKRGDVDEHATRVTPTNGTVQVHLRLRESDALILRRLAAERDQTISAVVRGLLRPFRTQDSNMDPHRS